jgi:CubicO group peptidase (beta-lactamase class C family)
MNSGEGSILYGNTKSKEPMIREDDIIERSLYESVFPGIVCRVWKDGKLLYERVAGYREFETRDKMTLDTIFDLASLTKPLATAVLVMRTIDEHAVSLEQKLGNFFPEAPDTLKQLTIRSLLIHTAGLAQPELNRYFPDPLKIDRKKAREIVLSMQPELPSGSEVLYSCTGYILLGFLLERVSGAALGQLFKEYMASPLGLTHATFVPPEDLRLQTAATEFCSWRKRRIRGEVHDESAYCLGGEAGNAGLFGTVDDVAKIASIFLNGGYFEEKKILSEESVFLMTHCQTEGMNRRRAVGFAMHDGETLDGEAWPDDSFGHTGFTGTSLFIDPSRRLQAITLTNRVYFGRAETADKMSAFRKAFHTQIMEDFGHRA